MSRCFSLGLVFLACALETLAATPLQFATPTSYPTGAQPRAVAVGDLNGDGYPDVIVANQEDKNISVLLGNGDGTFQERVDYSLGDLGLSWPQDVAVGDFNNDGKPDIAVITAKVGPNGGTALVLLGNGDGTLQPPISSPTQASPLNLATADVDGDGRLDLLVGGNGSAAVLYGNGDGTFIAQSISAPDPMGASLFGFGAADLNGDGVVDLFGASFSTFCCSKAWVFLADGPRSFSAGTPYPLRFQAATFATAANLNNSGAQAIVITEETGNVLSVLMNNGDGTFAAPADYYAGSGAEHAVLIDFNGDGVLDFAVASLNRSSPTDPPPDGFGVTTMAGNGDGTFDPQSLAQFGASTNAVGIATGDFNGDGSPDIVLADFAHDSIVVLLNSYRSTSATSNLAVPNP